MTFTYPPSLSKLEFWQWPPLIMGAVCGLVCPVFWVISAGAYVFLDHSRGPFFSDKLVERVIYWGVLALVVWLVLFSIAIFRR